MSYGGYEFNASSSSDPMQTSPSGPASAPVDKKARKPTSEQTMIPCTIRQLLQSQSRSSEGGSGNAVTVDGAEPHHVKVCACVKEVDVSATSVTYQVEDGSGLIEVKQWINDASDTEAARERRGRIKEGLYVKIVGKPNFFNGTVSISAYSVKLLSNPNEITHHFLESIWVHENATRGMVHGKVSSSAATAMSTGVGFGPQSTGAALYDQAGGGAFSEVSEYIKRYSDDSEQGVSIQSIVSGLPKVGQKAVQDAIDNLTSEGIIYSTVDEFTFKYAM
eukprot:CAMPEP_0182457206 /NCGR_PEP_ID=MMETSP1319-20130603/2832_1 /TAXON_ID=172717 /ORGANISM="Bolidomonas pacifica, Strain RCC208" /LENGTH=276 /DNA_ID=CAMNT_0024655623 /DNA_START=19 /DNA_END=849 /DNA_ORIENTATION=+